MAAAGTHEPILGPNDLSGGSGARLAKAVLIVAGACALVASLVTFVCVARVSIDMDPSTDVAPAPFGCRRKEYSPSRRVYTESY
jgi:hypothetical protein